RIRFLNGVLISASSDPLADLEGTYLMRSPGCTTEGAPGENGEWKDCSPEVVDCLSIERKTSKSARISVLSIQTNGHRCSASGIAAVEEPGLLTLRKDDEGIVDDDSGTLQVDYYSDPMQVLGPQVLCGARASWAASAFSKANRVSKKAANC